MPHDGLPDTAQPGRMTTYQHPGYATAAEVASLFGLKEAQVYRLAHKHEWRRYVLGGKVRYHRDAVEATMSRREQRRATLDCYTE